MGKHYALAREAILAALTAYTGITTADGATPANNTLICAALIGRNDFTSNKSILIGSGDADDESSGVSSLIPFDSLTGTITVIDAFSAQIKAGTTFRVLNINIGDLAEIKTQTDKLAGETPVSGATAAYDWNTVGGGTSGEDGGDVVTIGSDGVKYKLHSLLLDVSALTDGAKIHVKLFMQVNGNEKKVYDQEFTIPTGTTPPDTDGLWIVNGTVGIHEALRVEVYSDTSESVAIGYDYMLEAM